MNKSDKLIEIAKQKFPDGEIVNGIPSHTNVHFAKGEYQGIPNINIKIDHRNLFYDYKADTLTSWGWGLVLLFKDGYWCDGTKFEEEINYEIY